MKWEMRHIKASFFAGVSEWVFRLFCEQALNYNPLWVKMMGALGTGMILYSAWMYVYYKKETGGK